MYVNRSPSRSYNSNRSYDRDDLSSEHDPNLVGEHETPLERFMKDAVSGALRGLFREMYEFWRRYRIR